MKKVKLWCFYKNLKLNYNLKNYKYTKYINQNNKKNKS